MTGLGNAFSAMGAHKRFTLVDTFDLLIAVKVVAVSTPEWEGAERLPEK